MEWREIERIGSVETNLLLQQPNPDIRAWNTHQQKQETNPRTRRISSPFLTVRAALQPRRRGAAAAADWTGERLAEDPAERGTEAAARREPGLRTCGGGGFFFFELGAERGSLIPLRFLIRFRGSPLCCRCNFETSDGRGNFGFSRGLWRRRAAGLSWWVWCGGGSSRRPVLSVRFVGDAADFERNDVPCTVVFPHIRTETKWML
jgi:hypothetical protein